MNSSEAYHELLEEILNNLEEAIEEDNWDGIGDVVHQIREALDNPFDNYNTEGLSVFVPGSGILFKNGICYHLTGANGSVTVTITGA